MLFRSISLAKVTTNTKGSKAITIDTNGHNLTISDTLLLVAAYDNSSGYSGSLALTGGGTVTTNVFDFPATGTHTTSIDSETTLTITGVVYGNMDSGSMEFRGDGTLYIPASGINVDWNISKITFGSTLTVLPYGSTSYDSLSTDSTSFSITITFSCTRPNSGTGIVYFPCNISIEGSGETYSFNGSTVSSGDTVNIAVSGSSTTATLALSSGTISDGEEIGRASCRERV